MNVVNIIAALKIIDRNEPDKTSIWPARSYFCYSPTVKYSAEDAAELARLEMGSDIEVGVNSESRPIIEPNRIKNLIEGLEICFRNEPYCEGCDENNAHRPMLTYHYAVCYGETDVDYPKADEARLLELGWTKPGDLSYRWCYEMPVTDDDA